MGNYENTFDSDHHSTEENEWQILPMLYIQSTLVSALPQFFEELNSDQLLHVLATWLTSHEFGNIQPCLPSLCSNQNGLHNVFYLHAAAL